MRLVRFEATNGPVFEFPRYDIRITYGQDRAPGDIQQTPGGAFDPHGTDESQPDPFDIIAGFEQFVPKDAEELQAKVDETRGLRGLHGKLYAQPYFYQPSVNPENSYLAVERWIYARCVQVPYERTLRNYQFQPMDLIFTSVDWCWHGLPHSVWRFDRWLDENTLRYVTATWYADDAAWDAGGRGTKVRWDVGGFTVQMVTSPFRYKHFFVFDLPLELAAHLDGGTVSAEVRQGFQQKRIILGDPANVTIVTRGEKWEIRSAQGNYSVVKGQESLEVHFLTSATGEILINKGNAAIHDAIITIIAADADITSLEIRGHKSHLRFLDRITKGTALIIDCGKLTVENNGVNAYTREQFALGDGHKLERWFIVEPGTNRVRVDYTLDTPNGSTVGEDVRPLFEIDWYDGWK